MDEFYGNWLSIESMKVGEAVAIFGVEVVAELLFPPEKSDASSQFYFGRIVDGVLPVGDLLAGYRKE